MIFAAVPVPGNYSESIAILTNALGIAHPEGNLTAGVLVASTTAAIVLNVSAVTLSTFDPQHRQSPVDKLVERLRYVRVMGERDAAPSPLLLRREYVKKTFVYTILF